MNLYLLSQSVNEGYDTYDSCVVAAETEDDARNMHPAGYKDWIDNWAQPDQVSVKLLGKAAIGITSGVYCSSFNAG